MKIKSATVLLACLLLLSSFPTAVIACVCDPPCEGCQTCEEEMCVDNDILCLGNCNTCQDGQCDYDESLCVGGPCDGCVNGWCQDDDSKCPGECDTCLSGNCTDWTHLCPGECHDCQNGSCVDEDLYCGAGCQTCQNGTCVDNDDECNGCLKCQNDECVPDDNKCTGCEKCIKSDLWGYCVDDDSKCNAANCETCINAQCKVCGGDTSLKCCPDQSCVKPCELQAENPCNTSQDYDCIFCVGVVSECGEIFNARVYTGNTRYYCSEWGCTGDCVRDVDVLCYTEYDCYGALLPGLCALNPITDTLFCYISDPTVPDNSCARCAKDPDDPGEPGMVWSYKCL